MSFHKSLMDVEEERPSKKFRVTIISSDIVPSPCSSPSSPVDSPYQSPSLGSSSSSVESSSSLDSSSSSVGTRSPIDTSTDGASIEASNDSGSEGADCAVYSDGCEFDKLNKEFNAMQDDMNQTLARLRGDITNFKAMLAHKDSQNLERLRMLQMKLAKFPENELEMFEVAILELMRRKTRKENFAEALQGLVKMHETPYV